MKRAMVIGSVGAGKSTLIRALLDEERPASKTQSLVFRDWLIDTPGEYCENPLQYRFLIATSFDTRLLVLVQDATRERSYFPPGFAGGFPVPSLGVVTKIDSPKADTAKAKRFLRQAMPKGDIFEVSAMTLEGVEQLRERIESLLQPKGTSDRG
ncbi:EutP/PduV family microcompartment system protein [Paenibacillus pasadenensis]|uniref:EutP/PduV family microcompartment system protein n=1 Tax=Paenibacillus pasadenensis TaxID=217090 RepID=UPI002040C0D9|nr:EutP/PduV family microcompartment system protein [Paenibacillus pasadenensis]MCM3749994.1 EutP/PduV family microcompartment system protein [Paenibacillus pasadenensis]